ncbi:hypothetical protein ACFV97_29820 [Streptomyces sp. NPDC059913]|uniref:hypothetical protein n=1 Tax=unclassified Streptomyces TaxID=2593676 RepID=UPI0036650F08
MTTTRRPASELPADPAHLRLSYSHQHPAEPYDFEDTLEAWDVSIRAYHFEEDECEGGCTEACQDLIDNGRSIGHLQLWRLRDYTGDSRWEAADAESGDLESIAATVFDARTNEYSQDFEKFIEHPVGDLLILDRVFLDKEWRGFGLGPVFAAEAIRRLAGGCCAVAAQPGLGELPDGVHEVPRAYREQATKEIAALWRSIGFRDFTDGVQLLDPALRQPSDLLRNARQHLTSLSHSYQGQTLRGRA